jgi:thymidine phosphorylase
MPARAEARKLARAMVSLGNECGTNTRALLTDMDIPVGRTAGNWLEVKESVACLDRRAGFPPVSNLQEKTKYETGRMPVLRDDLRELVIACAAHLLVQTRKFKSLDAAKKIAADCLDSGAPRAKWDEMLVAQGADLDAFRKKLALESTAPVTLDIQSPKAGFISRCDARIIGEIIRDLGGGRLTKESAINHAVGIDRLLKPGEAVNHGSTLARIHAADRAHAEAAGDRLKGAFEISARKSKAAPLIAEVITKK